MKGDDAEADVVLGVDVEVDRPTFGCDGQGLGVGDVDVWGAVVQGGDGDAKILCGGLALRIGEAQGVGAGGVDGGGGLNGLWGQGVGWGGGGRVCGASCWRCCGRR